MNYPTIQHRRGRALLLIALVGFSLGACSKGGAKDIVNAATATTSTTAGSNTGTPTSAGNAANNSASGSGSGSVLPVTSNPITSTGGAQALKIASVLVENNLDSKTKKTADDHLEIALSNTGSAPLSGVEVYYAFTDTVTKATEGYYLKLPDTFSIGPGAKRVAHFDSKSEEDHFPINKFSLYRTSTNKLDVSVMVAATGAASQTSKLQKDAGGPEEAD